jgi:hypothetical protein
MDAARRGGKEVDGQASPAHRYDGPNINNFNELLNILRKSIYYA